VARCSSLFEVASILLQGLERGYEYGLLASEQFTSPLTEAGSVAFDPGSALYSEYCRILECAYPLGNPQEAQKGLQRYHPAVGSLVPLRKPLAAATLADLLGDRGWRAGHADAVRFRHFGAGVRPDHDTA